MQKLIIISLMGVAFFISYLDRANSAGVDKFIALGTASKSGSYYPVGGGICDLVNKARNQHGIRCIRYSTGGSVYNIQAIETGELDMGITRSDLTLLAKKGVRDFANIGANKNLRVIATLFSLPTAFVVKKDGNIKKFFDLKGSRINLGNLGSGKRGLIEYLMEALNWDRSYFIKTTELNTSAMGKAFCGDEIDVIIDGQGHPAPFYKKMISECGGSFLPVPEEVIQAVQKKNPGYQKMFIPGGVYDGEPAAVPTYGVKATLITSARVHPKSVYTITKIIFENLATLKKSLPAMQFNTPEKMANESILIDLHPGALRYYNEVGLR